MNSIFTINKPPRKWTQAILAFVLISMSLSACAQANSSKKDDTDPVVSAAKFLLAEQLKISIDTIQLKDIQPVQWPDGCLGIQTPGVMCAMHVVDGYRVTLSADGKTYEVRSNLDASQILLVPKTASNSSFIQPAALPVHVPVR